MNIIEPIELIADDAANELVITWSDGRETHHNFERLRWLCPCAECKGEWGEPGKLAHTRNLTALQTQLDNMVPVGRYALQPIWGDGHNSGLYTYDYLRSTAVEGTVDTTKRDTPAGADA